jgi:hypothetical protein
LAGLPEIRSNKNNINPKFQPRNPPPKSPQKPAIKPKFSRWNEFCISENKLKFNLVYQIVRHKMPFVFCKCGIRIDYGKFDKPPELCSVCRAKAALQIPKIGEMIGGFSDNVETPPENYFKDKNFQTKRQLRKKYNLIVQNEPKKDNQSDPQ